MASSIPKLSSSLSCTRQNCAVVSHLRLEILEAYLQKINICTDVNLQRII